MLTKEQLKRIMKFAAQANLDKFTDPLNDAMDQFEINTPVRQAAFIAQLAHESGEFRYVKELASGQAYEGRKDLGNTEPGDGVKYKGRGLIQLTGRNNYDLMSKYFDHDFINNPQDLESPEYATKSAAWFWHVQKNLNSLADAGDFRLITKKINGGYNGYDSRVVYWNLAKKELGVA